MLSIIYPVLGYIIGSVPFGVILTKFFGKGDLQKMGSGNIGATNVVRTQGKLLGALTFLFDFLKGYLVCRFLHCDYPLINLAILASPIIGHMFPIWLKFKGGKGVATYFGVLLALSPETLVATLLTWAAIFIVTNISAVAGLVGCSMSLFYFYYIKNMWGLEYINELWVLIGIVMLVFIRHHRNISQLLSDR